ncbi:hypothetical protein [Allobranchiibius sp. GilTou73]|uniref:hypothetical protein n=1 Tax=Allobranchiibius sp. GilTou73 TaxID=2904523 RepID=UPI001F32BA84|nr:hypothetical protein [Allobranchiibius sp. GilTou73]UIJ35555.1 hypothetical protein LVQ62_03950 [Allobranchiibius sp. GilTou73]
MRWSSLGWSVVVSVAAAMGMTTGAHAATTADQIYLHGGSRQALFSSKAQCAPHASWAQVQISNGKAQGIHRTSLALYTDPASEQDSVSSFPLAGGKWTYFAVYTAPPGRTITGTDAYIQTVDQTRNESGWKRLPDAENWFDADHTTTRYWSMRQCEAAFQWSYQQLRNSTTVSPGPTETCHDVGGQLRYGITYFMPTNHDQQLHDGRGDCETAALFPLFDWWRYDSQTG